MNWTKEGIICVITAIASKYTANNIELYSTPVWKYSKLNYL